MRESLISQNCYELIVTRIALFSRILNVIVEKKNLHVDFMHKNHISAILGNFLAWKEFDYHL